MDNKTPLPESFIKLARTFAAGFLTMVPGEYQSEDSMYKISLFDEIKSMNGAVIRTSARMNLNLFEVQVSKKANADQPVSFIFFMLVWFYIKYREPYNDSGEEVQYVRSDSDADIEALEISKEYGWQAKEILTGFLNMANCYPNDRMQRRATAFKNYVEKQ